MNARRYEAQQTVARAGHKETKRNGLIGALFKLIEGAVAQMHGVEKRAEPKVPLCIYEMNSRRRQIGVLTVLCRGIIGREKPRARDDSVKNSKGEKPSLPSAAPDHFAAAVVRILGSAQ